MSAFVVNDETINRIVAWLHAEKLGNAHQLRWSVDQFMGAIEWEDLAKAMHKLNCQAVSERYGEPISPKRYCYRSARQSTMVEAYKLLQCWHYQCTEGSCTEHPLYKAAEELIDRIAAQIASQHPDYAKADWEAK